MYLTKMQILSTLGTGYFLKIAKINSQEEKPICPYHKNSFPQNTKDHQSTKINSRKNFVPHGRMTEITWVTKMIRMNGMSGILG